MSYSRSTLLYYNNFIIFLFTIKVTDLHIGRSPNELAAFQVFIDDVIPAIKPQAVLVTGDITQGSRPYSYPALGQIPDQWKSYWEAVRQFAPSDILDDSEKLEKLCQNATTARLCHRPSHKPVWLDIKGNNDNSNVVFPKDDLYYQYSVLGRQIWRSQATTKEQAALSRHYVHRFDLNGTNYAIGVIDATQQLGIRKPFSFSGALSLKALHSIEASDSLLANSTTFTIWASHFPSSEVISERRLIGQSIRRPGAVFLAGHLHRQVYGKHPTDQLELVQGAFWKLNNFRIVAVDHGRLTFTEATVNTWPIILVTNPKAAEFEIRDNRQINSTFIRILVFSIALPMRFVNVSVAGGPWKCAGLVQGPLFVIPWTAVWQPASLPESISYSLDIIAVDAAGRTATHSMRFTLDPASFYDVQPSSLLDSSFVIWNRAMFEQTRWLTLTLLVFAVLICSRYYQRKAACYKHFCCWPLTTLSTLTRNNEVFYTIVFGWLVLPIAGPWFVGEMADGLYGIVFPLGIYLFETESFLPESKIAITGYQHVVSFICPALLYLSVVLSRCSLSRRQSFRLLLRLSFLYLIGKELWLVYRLYLAYGPLAFLTNTLHTWSCLMFCRLDFVVRRIETPSSSSSSPPSSLLLSPGVGSFSSFTAFQQ